MWHTVCHCVPTDDYKYGFGAFSCYFITVWIAKLYLSMGI